MMSIAPISANKIADQNPFFTANSPLDDRSFQLFKAIPADAKTIIELGCGNGAIASQYKLINPNCHYIGIESNAELIKIATKYIDRIVIGDLEKLELSRLELAHQKADCIIFGQHFPHLSHPLDTLQKYSKLLSPHGQILAIIPNLQHWHNLVKLIKGEWELKNSESHLFTKETIMSIFQAAGLHIYELQTGGELTSEFSQFRELMSRAIDTLGIDPLQFALQTSAAYYLVRAKKSPIPPQRLLIQTAIMAPTGCDRLRVLEPDSFSATTPGVRTISHVKNPHLNIIEPLPNEARIFIWQRTIMSYDIYIPKLKELLKAGYLILAEIDDNPIRRKEYADHKYLSYRGCHGVQTSTPGLGEFLREINPNVAVFTNQLAYLPPPKVYAQKGIVNIFFGALNREKDWAPIMPTLNQVIQANQGKVHFKVIHDRLFFDSLQTEHKQFESFCNYETYQEILHSCDIALLPLTANPVNEMKSDLKFIECAGHGVVVLASPTVYEKSIQEGETGLIYRTQDEFKLKLTELINDHNKRQMMADRAYNWVKENRLLCQHYQQRREWYLQMLEKLPILNAELRDRVPELFAD